MTNRSQNVQFDFLKSMSQFSDSTICPKEVGTQDPKERVVWTVCKGCPFIMGTIRQMTAEIEGTAFSVVYTRNCPQICCNQILLNGWHTFFRTQGRGCDFYMPRDEGVDHIWTLTVIEGRYPWINKCLRDHPKEVNRSLHFDRESLKAY